MSHSSNTARERFLRPFGDFAAPACSPVRSLRSDATERLIRCARKLALRKVYDYRGERGEKLIVIAEHFGVGESTAHRLLDPHLDQENPVTDEKIERLPPTQREAMRSWASTIAVMSGRSQLSQWVASETRVMSGRLAKCGRAP